MFSILAIILVLLATAASLTVVTVHATTHLHLARRPAPRGPRPPISVLKPIKGADDGLYENLAAFARLEYQDFEIILGIVDPDDPAMFVARQILRDFSGAPFRIVTGAPDFGPNPKVSNLAWMVRAARHDYVLVSDADVRPPADYLDRMTRELRDPRVGLVHSLLVGTGETAIGANLETLHWAGFVAPVVCAAQVLTGHPCVVGKSILMRLSALSDLGGWGAVQDVLAEDYALGQLFARGGHKVVLSSQPLPVVGGSRTVRAFAARHLRWSQMRRRINLPAYLAEPLLNPTPAWLLVALLATTRLLPPHLLVAAAVAVFTKASLESALVRRLRGSHPATAELLLSPLKDLLIFAVWSLGLFRRRVVWRGRVFELVRGSRLRPVPPRAVTEPEVVREAA